LGWWHLFALVALLRPQIEPVRVHRIGERRVHVEGEAGTLAQRQNAPAAAWVERVESVTPRFDSVFAVRVEEERSPTQRDVECLVATVAVDGGGEPLFPDETMGSHGVADKRHVNAVWRRDDSRCCRRREHPCWHCGGEE
jgi:hypothetical protein